MFSQILQLRGLLLKKIKHVLPLGFVKAKQIALQVLWMILFNTILYIGVMNSKSLQFLPVARMKLRVAKSLSCSRNCLSHASVFFFNVWCYQSQQLTLCASVHLQIIVPVVSSTPNSISSLMWSIGCFLKDTALTFSYLFLAQTLLHLHQRNDSTD